jgi:hypothetical protein
VNAKPHTIPKFGRGDAPVLDPKPPFVRGNAPPPQPEPEIIAQPEPTFSQSISNGLIKIRRAGPPPEPELFIKRPTRAQMMARR